jgi:O-antigen ligase/tetratricopeptide (TPR) repeat protein
MAAAASIFLVISLWLAVVLGPQMRMWPWGPALLALAAALGCAAITSMRNKRPLTGPGTLALGTLVAGWFAWRAWHSPVAELAQADMLLLCAAVGCFLVIRAISHDARAEAVFLWGLATLLLASVVMVFFQVGDPDFSQFRTRPSTAPTGFFGHYNAGSNFIFGTSFLLLGSAIFGRHRKSARIIWIVLAALGIAAVYFTRSRGAVLGVVVGFLALASLIVVIGAKRKAGWFAPAIVALPIIAIALGFLLFFGWEKVQAFRTGGQGDVVAMMDNTSRLRNYSLAFETIMLHPLTGGGSRSYSWESLQVWNPEVFGSGGTLPEQTHNEILQAATDYGLIGAGGLLALFGWIVLRGVWHAKFDDDEAPKENPVCRDALRLGGLAALAGMLAQSNFSFVFHLLPGVMLLGLALGRLATPAAATATRRSPGIVPGSLRIITALLAILIAVGITPSGIMGSRALAALIPVYYKLGEEPDEDDRLARFTHAIEAWPHADLHVSRAKIHHLRAIDGDQVVDSSRLDLARSDYLAAAHFNPRFPAHFVNAANLESLTENPEAAEALYEQAIEVQGNMEPAFRAHFHQAGHFLRKGIRLHQSGDFTASLAAMDAAMGNIRLAEKKSAWFTPDARLLRNTIYHGLAIAQEAAGDPAAAIDTCDAGLAFHAHQLRHLSGMIQYRRAMAVWQQRRPDEAYPLFQDARQRLLQSRNHLPPGVSPEMVQQHIAAIDAHLKLLGEAGFGSD